MKRFIFKFRTFNFDKFPKERGRLSSLFTFKLRCSKFFNCPIDLGKDYDIKQAGWVARTDRCCRALKKYQIWGLPDGIDIADADTTVDPADEAAWSAEMLSKGWRILVNDNLSKNVNSDEHDGRVINDVLPSYSTTRYIRVNVYEAFNQSFFDFGEIELLADFGN